MEAMERVLERRLMVALMRVGIRILRTWIGEVGMFERMKGRGGKPGGKGSEIPFSDHGSLLGLLPCRRSCAGWTRACR